MEQECEVCHNRYDKTFKIELAGKTHIFDSFECAIHALAPRCSNCGCAVIGHGHEDEDSFYCCANCAKASGQYNLKDRIEAGEPESKKTPAQFMDRV